MPHKGVLRWSLKVTAIWILAGCRKLRKTSSQKSTGERRRATLAKRIILRNVLRPCEYARCCGNCVRLLEPRFEVEVQQYRIVPKYQAVPHARHGSAAYRLARSLLSVQGDLSLVMSIRAVVKVDRTNLRLGLGLLMLKIRYIASFPEQ